MKKNYFKNVKIYIISAIIICFFISVIPCKKVEAANADVVEVSATYNLNAAIKGDGSLWMWGENYAGQIGDGTTVAKDKPIKIMENVRSVVGASDTTAALKTDGSLWMWGNNGNGQIGDGTCVDRYVPYKLMKNVKKVDMGFVYSAAIKTDGSLWMWGYNEGIDSKTPVKIMDNVKDVALSYKHTAVLKEDGSLWMWGENEYGKLGNGKTSGKSASTKIMDNVKEVALGEQHSAVIKEDGTLWMWGCNENGQIGDGTYVDKSIPVKIMDNVKEVALGDYHSAAIKKDGSLWMWGYNEKGQIDWELPDNVNKPVKIMSNVKEASLAYYHSAAIKKDGSLWMWGQRSQVHLEYRELMDQRARINVIVGNRAKQVITAKDITKTVSSSKRTISLNAKCKGDGKLRYKSSNKNISVNSNGKITIKKNYIGQATITITAPATGNYKKATKKIVIKVVPKKVIWNYMKSASSKQIKMSWKKSSLVSGYQCQISTSSKFVTNKKQKTYQKSYNANVKLPVKVGGLSKGKTYYVRVRAYKYVSDNTYYGAWSTVKKVKVK